MLIEVDHNCFINLDYVQQIEPLPGATRKIPQSRLRFRDGGTLVVDRPLDWFSRVAGTVVPAPPGFQVVRCWRQADGGDPFFQTLPVIAFRVQAEQNDPLTPITDCGEPGGDFVLVRPTGDCVDWDRAWDSVDEWKQSCIERDQ